MGAYSERLLPSAFWVEKKREKWSSYSVSYIQTDTVDSAAITQVVTENNKNSEKQ